jgi:hypothetical protein
MGEPEEEALRRLTLIRLLNLTPTGTRHCRSCGQEAECFAKRTSPSGDTRPRCLDCWKAER